MGRIRVVFTQEWLYFPVKKLNNGRLGTPWGHGYSHLMCLVSNDKFHCWWIIKTCRGQWAIGCLSFINNLPDNIFFNRPYCYWQKAVLGLYMTRYEYVWLCITLHYYVWLYMKICDFLRLCKTICYYFMTLYDSVWCYMTLYDSMKYYDYV